MHALFPWLGLAHALAGPPPLREDEPLPWPRAPELARRPVELVPRASVTMPSCWTWQRSAHCEELGPAFGGELAALYRPNPYFAFGGSATYALAKEAGSGGALTGTTLSLGIVGRVYLLETGALDPYLELLLAFGPLGRAGGGVDWLLSPNVKLGVAGGFSSMNGGVMAGLELGILLGRSL